MMLKFTPKILRVLGWTQRFIRENGYSPTFNEGAEYFNISKSAFVSRMRRLIKLGYITHNPNLSRTFRLTEKGLEKIKSNSNYYGEE